MSLTEPSQENKLKDPEISQQENAEMKEPDKNMGNKDNMELGERSTKPHPPLREHFSEFKEVVLKDKKMDPEDCQWNQTENKSVSGTLGLLKENLNEFRENVTGIFDGSSSKNKEIQPGDKMFHRQKSNYFKDNLSNIFGLSKEKDTTKENPESTFKIKRWDAERMDKAFERFFKKNQSTQKNREPKTFPKWKEEQMDDGLRARFTEVKTVDRVKNKTMNVQRNKLEMEKQEDVERISAADTDSSVTAEDARRNKEEEETQNVSWEPLTSEITLFTETNPNKGDVRAQPEDELWSLKNFVCYLTFDPNTANSELQLTNSNRKVTRVWLENQSSEHPDRFRCCPQVLCREGLLDSAYWELVWNSGADIGVAYNSISRDGETVSCLLGHNRMSWSLECSEGSYTPCHLNKRFPSSSPQPFTHKVGVYLNWSAGSLSFYCISHDTMVHLHTFKSTFTQPLYPAFWIWAYGGSVSLCNVASD